MVDRVFILEGFSWLNDIVFFWEIGFLKGLCFMLLGIVGSLFEVKLFVLLALILVIFDFEFVIVFIDCEYFVE